MRWLLCAVACAWAAQARAADPELHAVSLYGGFRAPREPGQPRQPRDPKVPAPARVLVDRPNKEVVLVLTAYEPVDWTVTATPKTKLTKVFLGGSHKQRAQVPKGVELVDYSRDEAKPGKPPVALPYLGNLDGMHFRPFVRELFAHTKLPLASFTGENRPADENPIVVNAIQKDDRLSADFPQLSPKALIPKFAFEGTRVVLDKGRDERKLFGAFTEAGPSKDAMPALPKGIALTAYDAGAKMRYGIDGHDLYVVDIEKRTAEKVEPVGVKPNWLTSITFDAKRGRVLMGGRNGFYQYVPKTGAWTELRKRPGEMNFALAWCKATDTLYAVRAERGPGGAEEPEPELVELAADGTVVKRTPLGPLVFPGLMAQVNHLGGRAQLVDLGKQLALLVHTSGRDGNG